jgi:hypothetical protein
VFYYFWALLEIQTMTSKIHILALDNPIVANEAQWKIEQLSKLSLLPPNVPIGH